MSDRTLAQALSDAINRLKAAGLDHPREEARRLFAHAAGMTVKDMILSPERRLSPAEASAFETLVIRRAAREPLGQILGRQGFWTLDLIVTSDTLAPRPDTETVVEAVLVERPARNVPYRILDLGTGTGCLILALLSEFPQATGIAVDASAAALAVARQNVEACGFAGRVDLRLGHWGDGLADGSVDILVSNPPYIPDADIATLEPEVSRWEPRSALAGGADGLECYRDLMPVAARLLAPAGLAAFEVGMGQDADVSRLAVAVGLRVIDVRLDLAGIGRVVVVGRR